MLSPYRVLDLTDDRAALGPMVLADLGADVIRVERPGARADGAFDAGAAVYNRNKRSVTLDLETAAGQEQLRRLAATADFLFENDQPGGMAARGLGFDDLRAVNPRLVYVAVTPFGQDGPYAPYLATDLTLAAMGGMMAINGDADRPPVRVSVPQAWLHAAAESATAALVAHARMVQTGEAQFVDVAVQPAVFWTTLNASIASAIQGKDIERDALNAQLGTITVPALYPAADGSVIFFSTGAFKPVIALMAAEGIVPDSWITDEDWPTYVTRLLSGQPVTHPFDEIIARVRGWTARHTRHELFQMGLEAGVFIAPENTIPDVLALEHLAARGYWQPLTLPDGRTINAPGPWVRFSASPIAYRRPAPRPGEHTDAILAQLATAVPEVRA
jgi:crotonobetainyl-CoA:carnitine CoA-transferase CaiB-like acyl-CoA transferase